MTKARKTSGNAPYFSVQSNYSDDADNPQYADHGAGWPFSGRKASGVSLKMNSLPLGREMVLFGIKGGTDELYQSPGNAPDYKLVHVDDDQRYTEIGVGWSFDKRCMKNTDGVHGISMKLHARPCNGNLVIFEIDEKE